MYMTRHHTGRRAGLRGRILIAAAAVLAPLAMASPAMAEHHPTGNFAPFKFCPLSNKLTELCTVANTNAGEFTVGKRSVPINKTITLQGGLHENEKTEELEFIAAEGAETLSKTPQSVPGGLFKILAPSFFPEPLKKIFNEFISKGPTGVNATAELVGKITISRPALFSGAPDALNLPVRVHLENEFLGPTCYVGSSSKPVNIELTSGTTSPPLPNKPITGSLGELEIKDGGNLVVLKKNSLVNNTFAAPTAEGCGSQILFGLFTGIIDSAVNSELELPSVSGNNTAILNGSLENASAEAVKASEK
jgi:hypothetical protein